MKKRILIMMQDKPGFFERRRLRKMLKKGGYEIAGEGYGLNVGEYAAFLQRTRCDLVLQFFPKYYNMKFYDKDDIFLKLRDAASSIPIVVCGRLTKWRDYLKRGAADFIELPTDEDTFLNKLNRVLCVPRIDQYNGKGKRVLVQQEDDASLAWINLLLRENGYKVEDLTYNFQDLYARRMLRLNTDRELAEILGEESKTLPAKESPCLLITDELETLREIQKSDPDMVVAMCGFKATESSIMECIRSGAKDFLLKPFKPEDFLHRVSILSSWTPKPAAESEKVPEEEPPEG